MKTAMAGYYTLLQYLQPFFKNIQESTPSMGALQVLVDLAKDSEEISPAHVAFITEFHDAFAQPEVKK